MANTNTNLVTPSLSIDGNVLTVSNIDEHATSIQLKKNGVNYKNLFPINDTYTNVIAGQRVGLIAADETVSIDLSADGTSYKLPASITVTGAAGTYTRTSDTAGTLVLNNPTGVVSFSVAGTPAVSGYTVVLNPNHLYVNVKDGARDNHSEDYYAADGTIYNVDMYRSGYYYVNGTTYSVGTSYTLPKLITKIKMHDTEVQNYVTYSNTSGNHTHDFGSGEFTLSSNITVLGQGCGYCIDENTLVTMYDGTEKAMKDINIGDEVLSIDYDTMKLVSRKVIYTGKDEPGYESWNVPSYFLHTFSDGTTIKRAMNHRFYNLESQGYKYMHEWEAGQHTYNLEGNNPVLISTVEVQEPLHYGRITLEDSNNYFANGLSTGDRRCCPNPVILDHKLER